MSYNIALSSSMRSNLLSLSNITTQMNRTQNILSTGLRVNSAIDNASSYYQARSLTNRARDLNNLLDSMSQGIQTIQTAIPGLDSANAYLEQALSVAKQALMQSVDLTIQDDEIEMQSFAMRTVYSDKTYQDYLDEGYKEITASMDIDEIQNLFVNDAKIILKEDITLSQGLVITADNITIFGNGKTLTVNADDTAAITVKGKDVVTDIKGLNIVANGTNVIGIKATESGTIKIDKLDNVTATGSGAKTYYYQDYELFNGKEYTQATYNQLSDTDSVTGTAVDYAMQYQATGVDSNDADFGQGKWYIGAIGEWTDLYGYDYANITSGTGTSGAKTTDRTLNKINATLSVIDGATTLNSDYYWSSTEQHSQNSWLLKTNNGYRYYQTKDKNNYVRCFQLLENCYNPAEQNGPQIGDILYSDKTWSSSSEYASNKSAGKVAVGVVFDIDTINGDVKIVALNDAAESAQMSSTYIDVADIPNKNSVALAKLKNTGEIIVTYEDTPLIKEDTPEIPEGPEVPDTPEIPEEPEVPDTPEIPEGPEVPDTPDIPEEDIGGSDNTENERPKLVQEIYKEQYNQILKNFNNLITDSSYQGVNLLTGGDLKVTFNENRIHNLLIKGYNINSEILGIDTAEWDSDLAINQSIGQIQQAIESLRNLQNELGNNLRIIQTRQSFTDALSDILEEGADKLVLADINEASAEYLMLQTRQQLAVNSLSLAAQSASSILSLF